ncbi:MAG: glycosyltransferase family 9 protein [Leptospiraceae bacterium]|nr:glycosyltransferase family 9 protein [Leptospiraceae bacterium]
MQKILIISKKSLGDLILQMGVIQALKDKHPATQISIACDERNVTALRKHPDIADVLPLVLKDGQAKGFFTVLGQIRRHKFDVILTFGRDSQACAWGFLARIPIRVGARNQPLSFLLTRKVREHASEENSFEFYHKLAQLVSPQVEVQFPTITIDKRETARLRADLFKQRLGRKFIIWHVGASIEEKRYPVFQIIETLRLFKKKRVLLPVLFAAGPGDEKFIAELEEAVNNSEIKTPKVFFADGIEFSATAALFSLAHLVVCNDAAPRHIAAAIGKKSLTLMPSHRRHSWQVYGEQQKAYFLFSDVTIESRAVDTVEPIEVAGMIRKLT